MLIATIPLIATIVGLLMYVLASSQKVAELGRLIFAVGLLVTLLAFEHMGAVRVLP
jgi:hypothetical protein